MPIKLLRSLPLIFFLHASYGKSYFINAEKGDDNAPGSNETPWKSFANIDNSRIHPGDTIYLKRGSIWEDTLTIKDIEGGKQKISFLPYPAESTLGNPIISCANNISNHLWPGVIENGGFESSPAGPCKDNLIGWKINAGLRSLCRINHSNVNGNSLELRNSGPTTVIKSNKFTLDSKTDYQLTGKINLEREASVSVYLRTYKNRSLLQLEKVGNSYKWNANSPHHNISFLGLSRPGTHNINISFSGISGPVYLMFSIAGKTKIHLDNIILTNKNKTEWSAPLGTVTVNPDILIQNGKRVAKAQKGNNNGPYWYIDTGHKLRIISETPLLDKNILIGQRRIGIHLDNSNNITLEGIMIQGCEGHAGRSAYQGAAILINHGSSYNYIHNIIISSSDEGIRIEGTPDTKAFHRSNVIDGVVIRNNRSKGISIRSFASDTSINNCKIENLGTLAGDDNGQDIEGVSIGGGTGEIYNTTVSNCHISNIAPGGTGPTAAIVAFNTLNTRIYNNSIYRSGKHGIVLANSSKSKIDYNTIDYTGTSPLSKANAGILVAADSKDVNDVSILNNTITNCINRGRFFGGITLLARPCNKSGCKDQVHQAGFFRLENTTVNNNIIYNCKGEYPFLFYAENIDFDTLTSDYNLFHPDRMNDILIVYKGDLYGDVGNTKYSEWRSIESHNKDKRNINRELEQHSILANPKFINPKNLDFRIYNESPARSSGKIINGVKTNIGSSQLD